MNSQQQSANVIHQTLVHILFSCYKRWMIVTLSIRDFVLAAAVDLDPVNGFTALTGETGAGKSIVLDALGCALGGKAEKRYVRARATHACVTAEFAPSERHAVWKVLEAAGISVARDETLTLRRVIPAKGPARAFLNDRPVSAALLSDIGETLVEIHGQHSASALTRPSRHRSLLDQFAGNEALLQACETAWQRLVDARGERERLEAQTASAEANLEWLTAAVEALNKLQPEAGEAAALTAERTYLMQAERIAGSISDAETALRTSNSEKALTKAARAVERVRVTPGLQDADAKTFAVVCQAGDALERALIELSEASAAIDTLSGAAKQDTASLERAEGRLFALRAEARKHNVQVEDLPDLHARLVADLGALNSGSQSLARARAKEKEASARWQQSTAALTKARKAGAARLEKAVMKELKPLKLGAVTMRVAITELTDSEKSGSGADHVEFEAETNPGAGFGPLRQIASGGELARFSLALKCALAETSGAATLIFDEVDQGVGGAVAAAIGQRLSHLSNRHAQVLAITHSPQVAAAASDQWLVEKSAPRGRKLGQTAIAALDGTARREEIARMLSGASITREARAAATRLLEGP